MDIDIEHDPVDALTMTTIMLNEISLKRPNHKFLGYLNQIDTTIRTQREQLHKKDGEIARLKQQISRL